MEGTATLRILGETAYPSTAASARVRVASFDAFLRPHGVALGYRPMLTEDEYSVVASAGSAARKAVVLATSAARSFLPRPPHDLLMVHRLRLLSALPGIDPPRRLDVYDLDDALFLGSVAVVNKRFEWAKQEAGRCVEYIRRARLVLAGNAFLAAKAREYGARAEIVPTCVDPSRQPLRTHRSADVVTVGWIGSQTTTAYLQPILSVFERLNERKLRARLVVVGGDESLGASWIEHRPWSLATESELLASFDIGVMPLPDTEWARGKCGYKILQYFSAGVPAIASPVGVNREMIGNERGLLASTPEEWGSALEQLINDVDERRERGVSARAFVERDYSYQRWAPELAGLLRSLGGG